MAVDIPFRLYNRNLVVVKATIGRTKDVNMIIDTGTNTSIISKKIARQLKVDGRPESVETLNGTIQADSLILPDIQMGSFRVVSPRLLVHDFPAMERNLGISIGGIVGLDILRLAPFTIDYQKKIVVVGSATALRNTVPFACTELFLTVRTTVDGQQLRLLLDSGTWELLVFRGRLRVAPNQVHLDLASFVSTPDGSVQFSWLRTNVSIGTRDLGAHEVAIAETDADPDFDGLLGFAGVGFHRVSFDFEKRLFSWE
ncbi:MAG: retropepsin-like aspartic protease [Terracidiphilus sp.]